MRFIQDRPKLFILAVALVLLAPFTTSARAGVAPTLNNGRKWRIAYYEGGPDTDYKNILVTTLKGLVKLGWMKPINLPKNIDDTDTRRIWNYLAADAESGYLEFLADGFMSAGWKTGKRLEKQKKDFTDLPAEKIST